MPFLTLQSTLNGPILDAIVCISAARAAALTALKQELPKPLRIRGLIDTGASCTCIDPSVLQALALSPTGSVLVHTPTTGIIGKDCDQYDISLLIPNSNKHPLILQNLPVIEAQLLAAQGIHALVGRDVLGCCYLAYDGALGVFTLGY